MVQLAEQNRNRHEVQRLLEVDDVLTDAMLSRRGLDASAFPSLTLSVQPMRKSSWSVDVTFRALTLSRLLDEAPSSLSHSAGTAAIRWQLEVPADAWTVDRGGRFHRPDAIWQRGEARVAVEYDAGYDRRTVRKKVRHFGAFAGVVWGTPSAVRTERMRADDPQVQVLTVDYWSSDQT